MPLSGNPQRIDAKASSSPHSGEARPISGDVGEQSRVGRGVQKIVLVYIVVAGGWIFLTDYLVAGDPALSVEQNGWSLFKGLLFVLATAWLLFHLICRLTARIENAGRSLAKSEGKYRLLVESSPDAIFLHRQGRVEYVNPAAVRFFGVKSAEDLLGRSPVSFATPEYREAVRQRLDAVARGESVPLISVQIERLDGTTRDAEGSSSRFEDENGPCTLSILRDLTPRNRRNAHIRRLNRLYAVLSQVNQAVVRLESGDALCREVCEVLVRHGKFAMAWIGEYDRDAGVVRMIASGGSMPVLPPIPIRSLECYREGGGLVEPSILGECTCISNDYIADARAAQWHDSAREHGVFSIITLPIRRQGSVWGVLAAGASEKNYFQRKEVRLLEEVGMDVSFAFDRMDKEVLRREAEEVLRKSEETFRTLFAASHDAIVLMDKEGYFDCNTAALKLMCFPGKEALRALPLGGLSPRMQPNGVESAKVVRELASKAFATGMERFEWVIQRYDGTTFPAEVSFQCMELQGRPILQEVVRDISERKATERQLWQLWQLSQVVEQSPSAVVITDTKGSIEYVNPKFSEVTGYSREEVLGQNPRVLKSGEQPPGVYRDLWAAITSGRAWRGEFHNRRKNGELFWESASISPLTNEEGEITHFLAVKEDINERKRTEEALRKSEEKFGKAFNTAPAVMVIFTAREGRCVEVNDAFEAVSGYSREEALGRTILDLGIITDGSGVENLAQRLSRGESLRNEECGYRTKEGDEVIGLLSAELIEVEGVACILAIILDITERKQMEEKFLRVQRMESIGALAGGMAHDLNNILAPIMMSASMLGDSGLGGETRAQLIAGIEDAARRGANIVNQVLTFARGVKGEHSVLDTRLLMVQVGQMVKEIFPKAIDFALTLPPAIWNITGDSTQLQQVFLNLCVNARDAMPQGGLLTLSVENCEVDSTFAFMQPEAKAGCYVEFKVADSGTGIPKRLLDRIFEPFFTTKEPGKGTGLGLSTAVGIVRSHGGFLKVDSEVGKGSVFHVFLPATMDAAPVLGRPELPSLKRGHGETVLVVDDEREILQIIEAVLRENGWKVVTATDGVEGVAAFLNHSAKIKAVLTDMVMPNMDGLGLIRSIRKLAPGLPILVSSGYSNEDSQEELRELRVGAFLKKPFSARQLLSHLVEALYGGEKEAGGK